MPFILACYNTCVSEADIRGCTSAADTKCLCSDTTFVSEALKCIQEICKGADLGDAISIGESVCLAAVRSQFYFIFSLIRKTYSRLVNRLLPVL